MSGMQKARTARFLFRTTYVPKNKAKTFCIFTLFSVAILGHGAKMLKKTDRQPGEARLRYLDADIDLLSAGDYVTCAVTARKIPLAALRYWSVDLQEAYVDATAAATRMAP